MAANGANTKITSKLEKIYRELFKGESLGEAVDTAKSRERFFDDLLCLKPALGLIRELCDATDNKALLSGQININFTLLFSQLVRCIKEQDDLRMPNALATALTLARSISAKQFGQQELPTVYAGNLQACDEVFTDLVSGVDAILSSTANAIDIKQQALLLAVTIVSSVQQGAINSYFLRRDLFSTLSHLMMEDESLALPCTMLLGLLANYRKYEARNPYGLRFEDLVEESVMRRIAAVTVSSFDACRDSYTAIANDAQITTLRGSLTSMVSSLSINSIVSSFAKSGNDLTFSDMPTTQSSALLALYDLINTNKSFCYLLLHPKRYEGATNSAQDLLPSLLSFSSYVFTHASSTPRSQSYSRILFFTLNILVEEDAGFFELSEVPIRLCRQKTPALSITNEPRPQLCSILDCILLFLRHNLQKKLDVIAYINALQLLHRILHQLKQRRLRPIYNFTPLWRALVACGAFLTSKSDDLSNIPRIEDLVAQILIVLDFACTWADTILKDAQSSSELYYEILRSDQVVKKLSDMTIISTRTLSPAPNEMRNIPGSPLSPSFSRTKPPIAPAGRATESVRNLMMITSFFGIKLDEHKERTKKSVLEYEDVDQVIQANIAALGLGESPEQENLRRYKEHDYQQSLKDFTKYAMEDAQKWCHKQDVKSV